MCGHSIKNKKETPSILYEPYWTQIGTMNWKNSNRASNWDHELKYESQLQTRIKSLNLNYIKNGYDRYGVGFTCSPPH